MKIVFEKVPQGSGEDALLNVNKPKPVLVKGQRKPLKFDLRLSGQTPDKKEP